MFFSSTLGFHHDKRWFFHQRPWDGQHAAIHWDFWMDDPHQWRDATSGCWMIGHGQPYVHVTSSTHGWLVESGCLEPARCFSSRSKLDSPWCSLGALLFTLCFFWAPPPSTFIDLRITKRRVTLHKTNKAMQNKPFADHFAREKIMFVFDGIHWIINCRVVHHQEHVAGYLDQVFWWNTGDLILNIANNMNWVCPEKGHI